MDGIDPPDRIRRIVNVLWPSFVIGGLANAAFFTLFDPEDLLPFGAPVVVSRVGIYTLGFFAFWLIAGCSSALTCFIQRSAAEVNRCPLPAAGRPPGCPKREEPGGGCA